MQRRAGVTGCCGYSDRRVEKNSHNEKYQFWLQDNQPVKLESVSFTLSKLNYLHNNPVKTGWVEKPEDYLLSSARDYSVVVRACCRWSI